MSGLEAFSLACNIMTVIKFALDTAEVCRTIKKAGSSNPDLEHNTSHRKQIFNEVEQALQLNSTQPTEAEMRLRKLATECMDHAEAIQEQFEYTSGQNFRRFATVRSTVRTVRRKGRIDECIQRLETARSTLDSALLAEIFSELIQSKGSSISIYEKLSKHQQELLDNNHQIRAILVELRSSEAKQAYEKFLLSLKYDEMNSRKTSIPHRHQSTFEWVFPNEKPKGSSGPTHSDDNTAGVTTSKIASTGNTTLQPLDRYDHQQEEKMKSPSLAQWLQEDLRCLYWINGKPGSGKSTFMKFIENDERTKNKLQIWQSKCNIVSHFLWKPGTENQQRLKGMLCSLLYQVLCEERDLALQILHDNPRIANRSGIADWEMKELERLLFEAFERSSFAYFILLDGLDELSRSDGGSSKLFPLLERLAAMDRIKLCVSSRPERPFSDKFELIPSLRMQDLTYGDIRKYTTDFLRELQLQPHDQLHEDILKEVIRKAQGVFIWVYVVLQRVKHGIELYNETWDNIYDRITQLPLDLMKLYKDMWSRSGEKDGRYVKTAARYFQYVRQGLLEKNIATLALVADDDALDTFTRANETPCVDKWIKMCQNTVETLTPVSVGLLEVASKRFSSGYYASASNNEQKILPWVEKHVVFIHRTVMDFLDSDEGKELFGKYTLGPKAFLSLFVKVELVLRSVTRYEDHPLSLIWFKIFTEKYPEGLQDLQPPRGTLALIHQCAANEFRGLVRPPCSISHENCFLFEASFHYSYEYVTEYLESREDYNLAASIYVLIGACNLPNMFGYPVSLIHQRYLTIRIILERHFQCQSASRSSKSSVTKPASDGIMLAWRCFLLHEQSEQARPDTKLLREEAMEMFINCGVMLESSQSNYLIGINTVAANGTVKIVECASDQGTAPEDGRLCPHFGSSIYIEVNDAFLVRRLSENIRGTSDFVKAAAKNAFMRPILARNSAGGSHASFFRITASEDDHESLRNWIFQNSFDSGRYMFPNSEPEFLKAVEIGEFESPTQALEKIGYDLPEANKSYVCLHRWVTTGGR